jgi:hypothetical protein
MSATRLHQRKTISRRTDVGISWLSQHSEGRRAWQLELTMEAELAPPCPDSRMKTHRSPWRGSPQRQAQAQRAANSSPLLPHPQVSYLPSSNSTWQPPLQTCNRGPQPARPVNALSRSPGWQNARKLRRVSRMRARRRRWIGISAICCLGMVGILFSGRGVVRSSARRDTQLVMGGCSVQRRSRRAPSARCWCVRSVPPFPTPLHP